MALDLASSFGTVHFIEPDSHHTHTAVLLHGRGSDGEEFATELAATKLSSGKSLLEALPGWRWVFPTSRETWSTVFQEELQSWFEARSLTDVTARQDLQEEGLRESVKHLEGILEDEIGRLGGAAENLVLGGISQGAAVGMWTLLCARDPARRLGAFVGASTWLPFASNIKDFLDGGHESRGATVSTLVGTDADEFVKAMMTPLKGVIAQSSTPVPLLSTPVFLGHGADDGVVAVELGQEARHVLDRTGFNVEWREYSGAEEQGHWLKAPEEVDDILKFLRAIPGVAIQN
jgi:predicted esterase